MSHTKRVPIRRPTRLQPSARAIELFEAMEQATRQRTVLNCINHDHGSGSGYCSSDCAACKSWYDAMGELHDELALKPWQWPVYASNPYPPGSSRALSWCMDLESAALWQLLNQARLQSKTKTA
jgi:hypothetical protein